VQSDTLSVASRISHFEKRSDLTILTLKLPVPQGREFLNTACGGRFFLKMGIKEKLENSADIKRFSLFKEGMFYKCYNEDAMVFAKYVKPYRVSAKYVKIVASEVLSLGFPANEVDKGNLAFDIISEKLGAVKFDAGSDKVTFSLKENLKLGFESWREAMAKENAVPYNNITDSNIPAISDPKGTELVTMIKAFDLANSTPMEGLIFIQQLKKEVQRIDNSNGNI
jgi:hypothetical protein